ncbi:MAG: hypothetical protein RLZZ29_1546, partial [Cyanobacteriota bacterium]
LRRVQVNGLYRQGTGKAERISAEAS